MEQSIGVPPERGQALDYLRRKGTEAPVVRLREHVARTFGELEALLDTVPAELRGVRPAPGRWSAHEVLDHLVESHRPAVEQLAAVIAGQRPTTGAIPAHLQSADPHARLWDGLAAELRGIHRAILDLLGRATDETPLTATVPAVVVVKTTAEGGTSAAHEWIEELDWKAFVQALRGHTAQHRAQILAGLAALPATEGPSAFDADAALV